MKNASTTVFFLLFSCKRLYILEFSVLHSQNGDLQFQILQLSSSILLNLTFILFFRKCLFISLRKASDWLHMSQILISIQFGVYQQCYDAQILGRNQVAQLIPIRNREIFKLWTGAFFFKLYTGQLKKLKYYLFNCWSWFWTMNLGRPMWYFFMIFFSWDTRMYTYFLIVHWLLKQNIFSVPFEGSVFHCNIPSLRAPWDLMKFFEGKKKSLACLPVPPK